MDCEKKAELPESNANQWFFAARATGTGSALTLYYLYHQGAYRATGTAMHMYAYMYCLHTNTLQVKWPGGLSIGCVLYHRTNYPQWTQPLANTTAVHCNTVRNLLQMQSNTDHHVNPPGTLLITYQHKSHTTMHSFSRPCKSDQEVQSLSHLLLLC